MDTPSIAPSTSPAPTPSTEPAKAPETEPKEGTPKEGESTGEKTEGEKKKEPAAEKRRHKVKVDNEEREVDDDELVRGYTHAQAANKKMQEAASQRREVQEFLTALAEDPVGVLERLNEGKKLKVDLTKAMEEKLLAKYKREMMSPEEIAAEEYQKKAKAWDDAQEHQVKTREEAQLQQMAAKYEKEYDEKLTQVLQEVDLVKDPDIVADAARYMQLAVKQGYDLDIPHIVAMVKEKHEKSARSLLGKLDGDQLIKFIGEDIANKIRKADLSRIRQVASTPKAPAEPKEAKAPREKQRLNPREFLEAARKRAGV